MTFLIIALAPVMLIFSYVYFHDKYEKEPVILLLQGFVAGILLIIPILFVESLLGEISINFPPLTKAAWNGFINASATEEVFKFVVVFSLFWRNRNFNEKFDGIVYAVAVSLGFAAVENFLFVYRGTIGTGIFRAFSAVPAHALFGIIMGYYFGKARFVSWRRKGYLFKAIFIPWLFHGLYDFFILSGHPVLNFLFIPLMLIMLVMGLSRMKEQSDASVFRFNTIHNDPHEPLA
jgi:protease PrsW